MRNLYERIAVNVWTGLIDVMPNSFRPTVGRQCFKYDGDVSYGRLSENKVFF